MLAEILGLPNLIVFLPKYLHTSQNYGCVYISIRPFTIGNFVEITLGHTNLARGFIKGFNPLPLKRREHLLAQE
jgi:hypothetical protein